MPYSIRVDISDGNIFETSQNLHEQMNTCGYIEQFDQSLGAKLMEDKAFNLTPIKKSYIRRGLLREHLNSLTFTPPPNYMHQCRNLFYSISDSF